jgi:AcrR family transcriptional regulator
METSHRPMRQDAVRNRERVLAAAREAFAEEGIQVPIDEIARRAEVGAGTVYRHFPTKEALYEAVLEEQINGWNRHVRDGRLDPDPGRVFFALMESLVLGGQTKLDLSAALNPSDLTRITASHQEFLEGLQELFLRAQAQGAVRSDLTFQEVHPVVAGAIAAQFGTVGELTRATRRILDTLRD